MKSKHSRRIVPITRHRTHSLEERAPEFSGRQIHRLKRAIDTFRVDGVQIVAHKSLRLAPRTIIRHCCAVQSAVGCAVTFQCRIRLVPSSSTTKTYTMRNVAVTTTEKSLASTHRVWFPTNVLQACVPGFGRGGRDGMYRRTSPRRYSDARSHQQLVGDAYFAPGPIRGRHRRDEPLHVRWNRRAASLPYLQRRNSRNPFRCSGSASRVHNDQ
jgi:hypothetical protein